VAAFTLLTSSEPKDQATKATSVAGTKRSRSYPGDEETERLDATLNPFAEDAGGSRPKNGMGSGGPPVLGVSPDHGVACLVDSDVRRTRNNSTGVGASLEARSRRLSPSTGGLP
jgi:hypothetical protein